MLEDIYNFVQLTPRVGTSGQPTAEQFGAIAEAGYAAVINLAMPNSDNAIPLEGSIVASLGMDYIHIPVPWDAPDSDQLRRFIGVMRILAPKQVWVHCAMNLRVSAFMYHYLRRVEGLSEADSRSPILARWEPQMEPIWRDFLGMQSGGDGV